MLPRDKSISAFVREVIEREIQRRKMVESAEAYAEFLKANGEEAVWLDEWEGAPLDRPPRRTRKKRTADRNAAPCTG